MTRSAVALTAILAATTWIWRVADARSLGIGGWSPRALSLAPPTYSAFSRESRVDKTFPDPRAALAICPRGIAPSRSHRRRARHGRHAGRFRQESDSGQGSRLL